jgi:hypothetical protein
MSHDVSFEEVENSAQSYTQVDEDSYATIFDLAEYREYGCVVNSELQVIPFVLPEEGITTPFDPDNRVTPSSLQPGNRSHGHSGSRSKRKQIVIKPLTPQERMDRRCRIIRDTSDDAYLPETDNEFALRVLKKETQKIERKAAREAGGRPRKGTEVRKQIPGRVEPATLQVIKEATGLGIVDFIEAQAANFKLERNATIPC